MMKEKLQQGLSFIENSRFSPLVQFIKFGLVGISNTLISYGIEMLCYYVLLKNASFPLLCGLLKALGISASGEQVRIAVVTIIAFLVSVTNSFYWNSRYVFKQEEKRSTAQLIGSYFKTMASYAVTGLLLSPAIKMWLSNAGTPYWLAALGSLVISIPLNYLLNKFWAFRKTKKEG